jgi:NADH:ubiquinone oxidoreductase subunit E
MQEILPDVEKTKTESSLLGGEVYHLELLEGELERIQSETGAILQHHGTKRQELIPIIQDVQEKLGYVPKPAMKQIAEALKIPEVDVYGVTTFYNQFRLNPPGKHQIKVCMGTACHMMGGHIVLDCFERRLEIKDCRLNSNLPLRTLEKLKTMKKMMVNTIIRIINNVFLPLCHYHYLRYTDYKLVSDHYGCPPKLPRNASVPKINH